MSALLAGELRRVLARRLVRVILLLVAVGIVLAGVITFFKTQHLSDAAFAARVKAAHAAAVTQLHPPPGVPACPAGSGSSGPGGPRRIRGGPATVPATPCFSVEVSVHDPRFHLKSLKGVFEGVTAPLAIVACLIGASLIGAEWPSRTITTILTWEPRRVRVLTAKVLVAAFVGVVLALVALVALGLALLPAALLHGTTAGTTGTWWRGLGGVLLRGLALVAVATTIGFAIAAIGRNTAAALGALFAYVVIIERVVSIFVKGMMRWLIIGNAIVFVSGSNSSDVPHQTVIEAGIYLAALAVGLYVVAAALFRSRDVA